MLIGSPLASWNITTPLRGRKLTLHRGIYLEDIVRSDFWANHVRFLHGAETLGKYSALQPLRQ